MDQSTQHNPNHLRTLFGTGSTGGSAAPVVATTSATRGLRSRPTILLVMLGMLLGAALWIWIPGLSTGVQADVLTVPAPQIKSTGASPVVSASGYVVARRISTVSASTTGRVAEIMVTEGDQVNAGQPLARLDDAVVAREIAEAESRLRLAEAALKESDLRLVKALHELDRLQGLARNGLISSKDLDDAKHSVALSRAERERLGVEADVAKSALLTARQQAEELVVRAPFAGVVVASSAQVGEIVSPISAGDGFTRTGICTVVDMASLEVEVDVNEAYIERVRPGQAAEITVDAYPDSRWPARVRQVVPTANRQKATVQVRVTFEQLDPRIFPDMGVKAQLLGDATTVGAAQPLLIPRAALRADGPMSYVFIVRDGRLARREVQPGAARGDEIEISSGLVPGDLIVKSSRGRLEIGAPVDVVRGDRS